MERYGMNMDREDLKKRAKRLLMGLLVMGIFFSSSSGMLINVRASETGVGDETGTGNGDETGSGEQTETGNGTDSTTESFQIIHDAAGGKITSNQDEYTISVPVTGEDMTSASNIIFPNVEYEDHIFLEWRSENDGTYNEDTKMLDWSGLSGITIKDLIANGWKFTAKWRPENIINIVFEIEPKYIHEIDSDFSDKELKFTDIAKVCGDSVILLKESITPEPGFLSFPEVEVSNEQYICIGWCEVIDGNEDTNILNGMPGLKYDIGDGNGGNKVTYTYRAKFDKVLTVNITYNANNETEDCITEEIIYQKDLNEQEYELILPEAPEYANHMFMGWERVIMNEDGTTGNIEVMQPGNMLSIPFGETVNFVAKWDWAIEEGSVNMIPNEPYRFAEGYFELEGDTTVYQGDGMMDFYVPEEGTYTFKKVEQ